MSVRVRYAPSPTGLQHIGSLRTALFNYCYAKSRGGTFILRIEDTDRSRSDPRAIQDIYDTFNWIGLGWDEGPDIGGAYGPYIQSERRKIYRTHAQRLLDNDSAYKCFCSPGRLDELRKQQAENRSRFQGYDRHCRSLSPDECKSRESAGEPYVIRFKVPLEGETVVSDLVLGRTRRKHRDINPDPVLLKADGFPTYHLANVVDDHLMEISHVLRAQEWVSSVALHILLYQAFGWSPPEFLHLPMVMGKDGSKLAKRHGSTSVTDFRSQGYLPQALVNYLGMVGWSYDETSEFFTMGQLEEIFADGNINKAPGVFDYKKLQWYNAHYIRNAENTRLVELCMPYMVKSGLISPADAKEDSKVAMLLAQVMPLAKERMRLLGDISSVAGFLFADVSVSPEDLIQKNQTTCETLEILRTIRSDFSEIAGKTEDEFQDYFEKLAAKLATDMGKVMMPLRMAVTGSKASPPLGASIALLGEGEAMGRLNSAIAILEQTA